MSSTYPVVRRSKKEKYFVDPTSGSSIVFPSINDAYEGPIHLSVVVPAYNEELRCK